MKRGKDYIKSANNMCIRKSRNWVKFTDYCVYRKIEDWKKTMLIIINIGKRRDWVQKMVVSEYKVKRRE